MDIRHCVIPAAGLGTRFLPATKALPKELLPVLDRPVLQWGVEEAVAAGLDTMVVVLSRGKELLAAHFDSAPELERTLEARGKLDGLEAVRATQRLAGFAYVYQPEPLGLGHAVLCARHVVGDRPFACLLPDDVSWGPRSILAQIVDAQREMGTPMLALMRVPRERISRYGSVAVAESRGRLHRVSAMVEKPRPEEAPSELAIMGRYVLTPAVFETLSATAPGAGGEIQLTDGIAGLLRREKVFAYTYEGKRYDCGSKEGFLQANVELALKHPQLGAGFREYLRGVEI